MINRIILFDIDGTLLNTAEEDSFYEAAVCEWLATKSIDRNWVSYEHVTDSGIAAELYGRINGHDPSKKELFNFAEIIFKRWNNRLEKDPTACVPTAGVELFLSKLQTFKNVSIAVATGGCEKTDRLKLDHCRMPLSEVAMATYDDSFSREEIMDLARERACQRQALQISKKASTLGTENGTSKQREIWGSILSESTIPIERMQL